jgi:hypothetical protein
MPILSAEFWIDQLRSAFSLYSEPLLRQVATKLARVRNQWPAAELIDRCTATLTNPATLDRRLADLTPVCRQLLAAIGFAGEPRLPVGDLVELALCLGASDGLQPVLELLEAGLLFPELASGRASLKDFQQAVMQASSVHHRLFTLPLICSRARTNSDWSWKPGTPRSKPDALQATHEADGLEWPLRLAALHQQLVTAPLRRTQSGDFFKRDRERLLEDPLLSRPPADDLAPIPELPLFIVSLAEAEGILELQDAELRAGSLPPSWGAGLQPALASLWSAFFRINDWNAANGWRVSEGQNPLRSAYVAVLMLLAHLPEDGWVHLGDIQEWLEQHHPALARRRQRTSEEAEWVASFILGICFQLRIVQACPPSSPASRQRTEPAGGDTLVRLSPTGRWLLGLAEPPPVAPVLPRTLLVQPNLEIIVYRQGLTPDLISKLSRFATWLTQGPACTLQLNAEAIYRALETGLDFDDIVRTLEQHGTRPMPPAVIEMLRTWSNKRERLSLFASAAILEFTRPEDMEEALARGISAVRLTDRLALVPNEEEIDYKHFRLLSTRDYGMPPERCVEVAEDGVTLNVDLTRSDLLLDAELQRFAEASPNSAPAGRKQYSITPASLVRARAAGVTLNSLDAWFLQRAGQPVSAAARLLLLAGEPSRSEDSAGPSRDGAFQLQLRRTLVLDVGEQHVADGLMQWPETRRLIHERLGPTALAVQEESVAALVNKLRELGISVDAAS